MRYTIIFEFNSGGKWEHEVPTIKDVAPVASMIDDTVKSCRVIDNVSGKQIQKLR